MYPNQWPIGTCHADELPVTIREGFLATLAADGTVSPAFFVHQTATEGPYIDVSGYKVRVTVETTDDSFIVRLA